MTNRRFHRAAREVYNAMRPPRPEQGFLYRIRRRPVSPGGRERRRLAISLPGVSQTDRGHMVRRCGGVLGRINVIGRFGDRYVCNHSGEELSYAVNGNSSRRRASSTGIKNSRQPVEMA